MKTNQNVMAALHKNTLFTTSMTSEREPWWEGIGSEAPAGLINWKGEAWDPSRGAAAHPNARYTVPARQSPSISPKWEAPEGVPISAFIFGGRRARVAPLVYESFDWQHGVLVGATMASETTAAATGDVGSRDGTPWPCCLSAATTWRIILGTGWRWEREYRNRRRFFHVNWFRKARMEKFLGPGYGENVRVLKWILERVEGRGAANETPIGYVPAKNGLTLDEMKISEEAVNELLRVNTEDWETELEDSKQFFRKFGDRLPGKLAKSMKNFRGDSSV